MSEEFIDIEPESSSELLCLPETPKPLLGLEDEEPDFRPGEVERVERLLLRGADRMEITKRTGLNKHRVDRVIQHIRRSWVRQNFTDLLELRGEMMAEKRLAIREAWKQWSETKNIEYLNLVEKLTNSITNLYELADLNKPDMLKFASVLKQTSTDVEKAIDVANKLDVARDKMEKNAAEEQPAGPGRGIAGASRAELVALLNAAQRARQG